MGSETVAHGFPQEKLPQEKGKIFWLSGIMKHTKWPQKWADSLTVSSLLTQLCHDRTEVHRRHRVTVPTKVALQRRVLLHTPPHRCKNSNTKARKIEYWFYTFELQKVFVCTKRESCTETNGQTIKSSTTVTTSILITTLNKIITKWWVWCLWPV